MLHCYFCKTEGATRRRTRDGYKLYSEPFCDKCAELLIEAGLDITLTPKNVAPYFEGWVNYPILLTIKTFL
jgi:hypothetical protein